MYVRKFLWQNKTLYPLVLTHFPYQRVKRFNCPWNFAWVLNDEVLVVAETLTPICQKHFTKVSRGVSWTHETSKKELFKVKEGSILDVPGALATSLVIRKCHNNPKKNCFIKFRNMFSRFIFTFWLTFTEWQALLLVFSAFAVLAQRVQTDVGFDYVSNISCSLELFLSLWQKFAIFSMPSP